MTLCRLIAVGSVLIFVTKKSNCVELANNLRLKDFNGKFLILLLKQFQSLFLSVSDVVAELVSVVVSQLTLFLSVFYVVAESVSVVVSQCF